MDKLTFNEYTTVLFALVDQRTNLKFQMERQSDFEDGEYKELIMRITEKDTADVESAIATIKAKGWGWEDENER